MRSVLPSSGADPALRAFYAQDPRRGRSAEIDLGLRWRALDGSTYRAAWIESTRELYTIRRGRHPSPCPLLPSYSDA
jgi:hypothetical protein